MTRKLTNTFLFKRSRRLKFVQRFVAGWLGIILLIGLVQFYQFGSLKDAYLVEKPTSGGVYIEGVVGEFSSLNPLYNDSLPTRTASRLIFSGLAKRNTQGQIEPDLAANWQVKRGGLSYEVQLRPNLTWHDGTPLSARDVAFTMGLIKNSAVRSPLRPSWQEVEVRVVDELNIEFVLPTPYTGFPNLLTTGIVPEHRLSGLDPAQIRVSEFNSVPIGSGPFKFEQMVNNNELRLSAFTGYTHGRPKLNNFIVKTYPTYSNLAAAFKSREVSGAGGYSYEDASRYNKGRGVVAEQWLTSSQSFLFMNTKSALLSQRSMRQALARAVDNYQIAARYGGSVKSVRSPLLPEHIGYSSKIKQALPSLKRAKAGLNKLGWKLGADGVRRRKGHPLKLKLVAPRGDIYPLVASQIQNQLKAAGVNIEVRLENNDILQQYQTAELKYDLLLFNISLGADADVYPYWHSSQIGGGFNFSNYNSAAADSALEAGRTRLDSKVRAVKYQAFLKAWVTDAPAVALYRQTYPYAHRRFYSPEIKWLVEPLDRFNQVHEWSVKTAGELKRLAE